MMNQEGLRPLIMITNDDGVAAPGIRVLADVAMRYADVLIVAPDGSYSGKSHSFTVMDELRVRRCHGFGKALCYAVKGTPVDCVKLGYYGLAPRRPELVLSGINHGSNTAISVHYSGTLGAAREAALIGAVGIGFSYADADEAADMTEAARVADAVLDAYFRQQLPRSNFLSVNIPRGKVQGLRMARMAMGRWVEKPIHYTSPMGHELYWLDGSFDDRDKGRPETDEGAIAQGWASITPLMVDVTDYDTLERDSDFHINL